MREWGNMNDVAVSNDFKIDDIHKIRYENYERIKNMTHSQIIEHTRREAQYGLDFLKSLREYKDKKTNEEKDGGIMVDE